MPILSIFFAAMTIQHYNTSLSDISYWVSLVLLILGIIGVMPRLFMAMTLKDAMDAAMKGPGYYPASFLMLGVVYFGFGFPLLGALSLITSVMIASYYIRAKVAL